MIRSIFAIARTTVLEQVRNRLYLVILFFAAAVLAASILVGELAPTHRSRVIFDLGLVALELFGLATAVLGSVSLVLQEMESKTIYLILTRPMPRIHYIIGRFLGLMVAVTLTMGCMALLHVLVLVSQPFWFGEFTSGWSFWGTYPTLVLMSVAKMAITSAIALFFSLFATSQVSALVFTASFWVAGHFGSELEFLVDRTVESGPLRWLVHVVTALLPNFQHLNFRDFYAVPAFAGFEFLGTALLYSVAYAGFFLAMSGVLFSRKEF